jgi:hypothetical protein
MTVFELFVFVVCDRREAEEQKQQEEEERRRMEEEFKRAQMEDRQRRIDAGEEVPPLEGRWYPPNLI